MVLLYFQKYNTCAELYPYRQVIQNIQSFRLVPMKCTVGVECAVDIVSVISSENDQVFAQLLNSYLLIWFCNFEFGSSSESLHLEMRFQIGSEITKGSE